MYVILINNCATLFVPENYWGNGRKIIMEKIFLRVTLQGNLTILKDTITKEKTLEVQFFPQVEVWTHCEDVKM